MSWNPQQYLQYEGERLRPALDLMNRIPLAAPRTIVDLVCGAGNVTRMLGERWPTARIVGVDNWTTEYLQVLAVRADGDHPVVAWTRGTWLVPFMAALDAGEQREFLAAYTQRLTRAYPPLPDGRTLFPFKRLFLVANR